MTRYLVQRVVSMIPVLVLISLICFCVVQVLPGDVALAALGEQFAKDQARYEALREEMGLDRPLLYRYFAWALDVLMGDFGTSVRTGEPVTDALVRRLEPTLQLTMMALIIAIVVGLPAGIASAIRPNSVVDSLGTLYSLFGVAMPNFWLGTLLVMIFSLALGWLPPSGYIPLAEDPGRSLQQMLMPSIALGTSLAGVFQRQTRSALLEVLQEHYIRTAHSKGLRAARVVFKHALRNAFIPVLTVIGMQTGRLFGGSVTIEIIFAIPGMGRLAVDSIYFRDYQMLQAIILVMAVAVLLLNLVVDVLYAVLDPRIRYA